MQLHTTEANAFWKALDESITGREVSGAISQRGGSLISTIACLNIF